MFILADDDDDEEGFPREREPHSCEAATQIAKQPDGLVEQKDHCTKEELRDDAISRYYLAPKDTLQGIALRYGVNVSYATK